MIDEDHIETQEQLYQCKRVVINSGYQVVDFSHSNFFGNLVKDISINTDLSNVVDQDYNGNIRLPVSNMVATEITDLNDTFKANFFSTGSDDKTLTYPIQPTFMHRYAVAGDNKLTPDDTFHYRGAQEVPDKFCLLLKESTPSTPSIQSGSVMIPDAQCSRVEGSQAYNIRVCSFVGSHV